MFSAITRDPKLLKDTIDTVSQLIDEGLFRLKTDGIELVASDRATVSVVELKLSSSCFDVYKCDKNTSIGLNLISLLSVLKRAGSDDRLALNLNEEENRLEITLEGRSVRRFAIPLLDISPEEVPPIHQLQFPALLEIKADILEQGIVDADVIADSVVIEIGDNKLKMFAEGDSSKTELNIEKGSDALVNLVSEKTVRSRYPLDYLKKMIKASKIADNVTMRLGSDYPLKMEFKGDKASMTMVLAPRVAED